MAIVNIRASYSVRYTPWAIKRAALFSIITPAFRGRFFILFVPVETGMNALVNKSYHFSLNVSPHYLTKLKTNKTAHFGSIITVRSIKPVVRNFHRKSSNVRLFLILVRILI